MRCHKASAWKSRCSNFSPNVSSVRAAVWIFARASFTRHTSRLFFRPYSLMISSFASKRLFSKSRYGLQKVVT